MTGVEIKFIQSETLCFRKGCSQLSSGACLKPPLRAEVWQWFLLAATDSLLQFAHSESRVEQRQYACFMLGCWRSSIPEVLASYCCSVQC